MKEKINWVINYMKNNSQFVDVCNADFVDDYIAKFEPKKYRITNYGANKCPEIGRVLKAGYDNGVFERKPVGIPLMMQGYPKWVYVYSLKQNI